MNKSSLLKGYIFIIVSSILYGCMPLMAKHIYADGVTPMTLALLRNGISIPFMALIIKSRGESLKIPPKAIGSIALIGVLGCSLTPVLLFSSYNYMASGTATVFHFIYPAVVCAAEVIFLKKKLRGGALISLLMCISGIWMFYTPGAEMSLIGSILALSSGFTFAAYIVLLSVFRHRAVAGFRLNLYISLISTAAITAACLFSGQFAFPRTAKGWLLCILFALLIHVGSTVLFQSGTFLVGGQRASILSTLEPITSLFIGAAIFHEAISGRSLIGAVLVLAASVLIARSDMKKQKK